MAEYSPEAATSLDAALDVTLADAFRIIHTATELVGYGPPQPQADWAEKEVARNATFIQNLSRQRNPKIREMQLRDSAMHLGMAKGGYRMGDYAEAVRMAQQTYGCGLSSPAYYLDNLHLAERWVAKEDAPAPRDVTAAYLMICEHNLRALRGLWRNPAPPLPIGLTPGF